jgi:hypothetical protein
MSAERPPRARPCYVLRAGVECFGLWHARTDDPLCVVTPCPRNNPEWTPAVAHNGEERPA